MGSTVKVLIIGRILKEKGLRIALAESCTGGLVGSLITDVPGSSEYFKGGIVAYGNEIKKSLLGVLPGTLKRYGAVSEKTASEMAAGVRRKFNTEIGLAITGIAGPGGGSKKKPVGTVFVAVATDKGVLTRKFSFHGSRVSIKKRSAAAALRTLEGVLTGW